MKKEYNFWVYILTNWNKKTLYVGRTDNLVARLKEHYQNRGKPETFAGRYFCYFLVYHEWDKYVWNSIHREKEIKSWTREKKEELINSFRSLTNSVEQHEISEDIVRFSFQGVITPWIFEGFSNFFTSLFLIFYRSTEFVKERFI